MKTIQTVFKLNRKGSLIMLLFIMIGITSCSKNDDSVNKTIVTNTPEEELALSNEKQITSFVFLLTNNAIEVNVVATIDEETKTITATMPADTNLSGLLPEVQVSDLASINLTTAQNFSEQLDYIVTAEDGSTATYTAIITKVLSQRDILRILLDMNPGNTLGWDIPDSGDLGALIGVFTDVNENIFGLDISDGNLTTIPPEIGQLTSLIALNMSNNDLTALPSELEQLTALIELTINFNKNLKSLPNNIGKLSSSLSWLSLTDNALTSLPLEIGELTGLKYLNVSGNQLSILPSEIGQLINLEYLEIERNQLNALPPEIGFIKNLETLRLKENNLTSIPQAICNLEDYYPYLDVQVDNNVTCSVISQKDALISIYSANPNNTLGWGVDNYPGVEFYGNGDPKVLTLNNKNLTQIPSYFNKFSDLKILNVDGNNLQSLPESIGKVNSLRSISAANNNLSTVPSGFGVLTNLTLLNLTENPITSIPQGVCDLQAYNGNGRMLIIETDPGEGCN